MKAAADTLGVDGIYQDPLWRVAVALTPLEQDLLRCWWVRRLGFVAHAGASVITTTQSYSRLEHSLGVLALVAHFQPDDELSRAAALVHDIGHLPFSHTFEGAGDLDHHSLGIARTEQLAGVFRRHGIDAADVIQVEQGRKPSILHAPAGQLTLDHLDSFVRSGRSHGRIREAPASTLTRLRVTEGAVDTDSRTAAYLVELIHGEARSQCSPANVLATGVMRELAARILSTMTRAERLETAATTDDEFWGLLLGHPETGAEAQELRRDPAAWSVFRLGDPEEPDGSRAQPEDIAFQINRLYVDLPLIDGEPWSLSAVVPPDLPTLPLRHSIRRRSNDTREW